MTAGIADADHGRDLHMDHASIPAARLLAFGAISIALHLGALSAHMPGGQSRAAGNAVHEPLALHVTLAPLAPPSSTRTAIVPSLGSASDAGDTSAMREVPPQAPLPVPDTWFPAEALSVRAEPLTDVQILYPPQLAGSGITGVAQLLLHIDERGIVRRARIEMSGPGPAFGESALSAWRDMRFSPALKDGVPVKSRKRLEISFLP